MDVRPTPLHGGTIDIETRKAFSPGHTHTNTDALYIAGCDEVINVLCNCNKHEGCMATFCFRDITAMSLFESNLRRGNKERFV